MCNKYIPIRLFISTGVHSSTLLCFPCGTVCARASRRWRECARIAHTDGTHVHTSAQARRRLFRALSLSNSRVYISIYTAAFPRSLYRATNDTSEREKESVSNVLFSAPESLPISNCLCVKMENGDDAGAVDKQVDRQIRSIGRGCLFGGEALCFRCAERCKH